MNTARKLTEKRLIISVPRTAISLLFIQLAILAIWVLRIPATGILTDIANRPGEFYLQLIIIISSLLLLSTLRIGYFLFIAGLFIAFFSLMMWYVELSQRAEPMLQGFIGILKMLILICLATLALVFSKPFRLAYRLSKPRAALSGKVSGN